MKVIVTGLLVGYLLSTGLVFAFASRQATINPCLVVLNLDIH